MSRESCIQHRPNQRIAIVRADYYEITQDHVAAALLNEFEFRANAVLVDAETLPQSVYIGVVLTKKLEAALIHISTDKQIRQRLKWLEEWGFISSKGENGKPKSYTVHIAKIQERINSGQTTAVKQPRSNNRGQMTGTSVKQPRSNDDLSIYKKDLLKESSLEEQPEKASEQENLNIDPEATQYDACQSKTQTDQLPTQNNSLDKTNYSAAVPQNEVSSGLTYLHPAQRANDRFQQRGANIPEWRIGWGPNDWNEQILGWWVKWLDKKWDGQHSRADAISYIVKRERPDHAEYPTLIARLEEVKQFGQRLESASQKQRSQTVVELEELATPDQVKQFSELAQQMQRQRMLKSAKGA